MSLRCPHCGIPALKNGPNPYTYLCLRCGYQTQPGEVKQVDEEKEKEMGDK